MSDQHNDPKVVAYKVDDLKERVNELEKLVRKLEKEITDQTFHVQKWEEEFSDVAKKASDNQSILEDYESFRKGIKRIITLLGTIGLPVGAIAVDFLFRLIRGEM